MTAKRKSHTSPGSPQEKLAAAEARVQQLEKEVQRLREVEQVHSERTNLQYLLYTTKELTSSHSMEQMIDLCIERLGRIFSAWSFGVMITPAARPKSLVYQFYFNMPRVKIDHIAEVNYLVSNEITQAEDADITFLGDGEIKIDSGVSKEERKHQKFYEGERVFGSNIEAMTRFMNSGDGTKWIAMPGDLGEKYTLKLYVNAPNLDQASLSTIRLFLNLVSSLIQNHLLKDELRRVAETDALTGLLNRGGVDEVMIHQIALARREHPIHFSIIAVDVNGLKKINDECGHDEGDRLLKAVGKLLVENCRHTDFVARPGGDEFVVICPSTRADEAQTVIDRIREKEVGMTIDCHLMKTGQKISYAVTVSLGVASSSEMLPEEVAKEADRRSSHDKENFYKTHTKYR